MSNFYAEQAFLFQSVVTIEEQRKRLNEVVKYFKENEAGYEPMLQYVAGLRALPVEAIRGADAFFINEDTPLAVIPEEYRHESYGICNRNRVIYAGRCIYPVKDVNGDVMGFCGWDPNKVPKYLDSKNYGYKAKSNSLYGMERLKEYYSNDKPVILVEGLVDCLLLRSIGVQALALLGSMLTSYVTVILSRFGDRLVVVPDNDNVDGLAVDRTAGEGFVQQVFRKLPKARVYQTIEFNDLNDCWRAGEEHKIALAEDFKNINNMFYQFKEIRQRFKPKWRGYARD